MLLAICTACVHPAAQRGRRALDDGAYALAATELGIAVRARPGEVDYWVDLGRAEVGRGHGPGAVRALGRARALSPSEARLAVYLGHARELMHRYDLAELDYRTAVSLSPDRPWTHRVLGTRLLRWGRAEEAVAPLERAVALDPDHAETRNALALALFQAGDGARAEATFRTASARFPRHRGLALGHAIVLVESGNYEAALVVYAQIARRWPDFAAPYAARSILLAQLGRHAEAAGEMEEALARDPRNPSYRVQRDALRAKAR